MKTVVIGVTGCIAAYKSCEIIRGLQKSGRDLNIKVVMTEHAAQFVGPTTFRALTGNEVAVGLFDEPDAPIHHISLAREADVICVAPATANFVAKVTNGISDDLLSTTVLAFQGPLLVAPAMNEAMYDDPATQQNLRVLESLGHTIIEPESGYLACGTQGKGRLADPQTVVAAILTAIDRSRDMEGKRVLVTAGPTQEPLDPVRCLTNHSSGKAGYEIAREALSRGAQVTLVTGPTALVPPLGAEVVKVTTALQMLDACRKPYEEADISVFVAAVSDWRPARYSDGKMKHDGNGMTLELVPNPDIAATLGAEKRNGAFNVVFAAETGDPIEAARSKLVKKNADMVVANDVSGDLGFGTAENHVWFVTSQKVHELPTLSKRRIARKLFDTILDV